ncbi:hypothetical protein ACFLXJ_04620 [Chloroflexota bacterium]
MEPELSEMDGSEAEFLDGEDLSEDKPDVLPEYCQYKDEGCDLADSCLECPFPQCVYEQHGGKQRWLKKLRDREVARLFTSEGKGIKDLASTFSVSQRTVQRALKNSLKKVGSD